MGTLVREVWAVIAWTPDPERHRPEGMEMAGRLWGLRPADDGTARLIRAEDALREIHAKPYRAEEVTRRYFDALEYDA